MSKGILTAREREVFELLILNKSTKEISTYLGISEKTVRNHISNVMQKMNVKGRRKVHHRKNVLQLRCHPGQHP